MSSAAACDSKISGIKIGSVTQPSPNPYSYTGNNPSLVFATSLSIVPSVCDNSIDYSCECVSCPVNICNYASDTFTTSTLNSITGQFTFSSTDKIGVPAGDYQIKITGTVNDFDTTYSDFSLFSFSINSCELKIANPPQIPALRVHYLGEGLSGIPWTFQGIATSTAITGKTTKFACLPPTEVSFFMKDGTQITNPDFIDNRKDMQFQVASLPLTDTAKISSYEFSFVVSAPSYGQSVTGYFQVDIRDRCTEPFSIKASVSTTQTIKYTLTTPAITVTYARFTVDPPRCAVNYSVSVVNPLPPSVVTQPSPILVAGGIQIKVTSNDILLVGSYTITIKGITGVTTQKEASMTITLDILNPCIDPNLVKLTLPSPVTPNQTYTIFTDSITAPFVITHNHFFVSFNNFFMTSACGKLDYAATFDSITVPSTLSASTSIAYISPAFSKRTFQIQTQDLSLVGLHTVKVTAFLQNFPNDISLTMTFTIDYKNPCVNTAIVKLTATTQVNPDDYVYKGPSDPAIFTLNPFTIYPTFCPIVYSCKMTTTAAFNLCTVGTFDTNTGKLVISTTNFITYPPNTYAFAIVGTVLGATTVTQQAPFQIKFINPCLTSTLTSTTQTNPADYLYKGSTAPATFTLNPFAVLPALCTVTYSCRMTTVATFNLCTVGTFTPSTGKLVITTMDFLIYPPNTYSFAITGSVVGATSITAEASFQIKFVSPCLTATLTPKTQTNPADYLYGGSSAPGIFTLSPFTVVPVGCQVVYSCRMITIVSQDLCTISAFESATGKLVITTVDYYTFPPNTYSFAIKGSVLANTSISSEASFSIKFVINCLPATLSTTTQTNPADYAYKGSAAPGIFTLNPFVIEPTLCSVVYSCKMNTVATFNLCTVGTFNTSTGLLAISTTDFITYPPNLYSFTITGSVVAAPTTSKQVSFQFKLVSPCPTAVLTPTTQTNPVDYLYTGSASAATFTLNPIIISPAQCQVFYSCKMTTVASFDLCNVGTFNTATGRLVIATTDFLTYPQGVYSFAITGSVVENTSISTNVSFQIKFVSPCQKAILSIGQYSHPSYYAYTGLSQPATFTLQELSISPAQCQVVYSCKMTTAVSFDLCNVGIFNTATGELVIATEDFVTYPANVYSFTITALVADLPTIRKDVSFQIRFIQPCPVADLTPMPQSDPADYVYTGSTPAATFTLTPFQIVPTLCTVLFSCEMTTVASFDFCRVGTFNFWTGELVIATDDFVTYPPNTYTFGIKGSVVGPNPITAYATFQIKFVSPCLQAILTTTAQTNPADYAYKGLTDPATFTLNPFKIVRAQCQIVYSCKMTTVASFDLCNVGTFNTVTGKLVISTEDFLTYPPDNYSFTITGSVAENTSITENISFNIKFVSPCPAAILTATPQTNPPDYSYAGSSSPAIFTLNPFTISPVLCSVVYSCKMTIVASFDLCNVGTFNTDTGKLVIATEDFVTYTPKIYSFTITGYVAEKTSTTANISFQIKFMSPCPAAILTAKTQTNPPDYEYAGSSAPAIFTLNPFAISPVLCSVVYSCKMTTVASFDLCNVGTFNTATGKLIIATEDFLTYPPNTYSFTITGLVAENTSIIENISFHIKFLSPCPAAILTATPQTNPPDYSYAGSSSPAIFTLNPFVISPVLCSVVYSCEMTTVASFDLCNVGTFNAATGKLVISTEDFLTYPAGDYVFIITGQVTESLTTRKQVWFKIKFIQPCPQAILTATAQTDPADYVYTGPTAPAVFTLNPFTISLSLCTVVYSCKMTTITTFDLCNVGTFNTYTGKLVIETEDFMTYPADDYSFSITGSVVGPNTITAEVYFKIKFINPCLRTKVSLQTVPFKNLNQFFFDPDTTVIYDVQALASHNVPFNCGALIVEFNFDSNTPFDPVLFDDGLASLPKISSPSQEIRTFTILSPRNLMYENATFVIKYKVYLAEYSDKWDSSQFTVSFMLRDKCDPRLIQQGLREPRPDICPAERPPSEDERAIEFLPQWLNVLKDQRMTYLVSKDLSYKMGNPVNFKGEKMKVSVFFGNLWNSTFYEVQSNSINVIADRLTLADIGKWNITIFASYQETNGTVIEYKKQIWLYIDEKKVPFIPPIIPPDKPEPSIIPKKPKLQPLVWDKVNKTEAIEKQQRPGPMPYIKSYSWEGQLKVGWFTSLVPYNSPDIIPYEKIAIDAEYFESKKVPLSRNLKNLNDDFLLIDGELSEKLKFFIEDAVEIAIFLDDPDEGLIRKTNFTWEIESFKSDEIVLQFNFESPEDVSDRAAVHFDTFEITFWGTKYFKDDQGREVPFGTKLQWRVFRQIDVQKAEVVRTVTSITDSIFYFFGALAILLALSRGPLLPVWMFFNSLQLIVHLPMIRSRMPATANIFILDYLAVVRLQIGQLSQQLEELFGNDSKDYLLIQSGQFRYYNELTYSCGYHTSLVHNLIVVSTAFILIAAIWILLAIKDCLFRKKRHEPWCFNFLVRFLYEVFFEICISLTISFTVVGFEISKQKNKLDLGISVTLAVITFLSLCFLGYLCFRKGPYIKNSFEQKSYVDSFWHFRQLKSEFLDLLEQEAKIEQQKGRDLLEDDLKESSSFSEQSEEVVPHSDRKILLSIKTDRNTALDVFQIAEANPNSPVQKSKIIIEEQNGPQNTLRQMREREGSAIKRENLIVEQFLTKSVDLSLESACGTMDLIDGGEHNMPELVGEDFLIPAAETQIRLMAPCDTEKVLLRVQEENLIYDRAVNGCKLLEGEKSKCISEFEGGESENFDQEALRPLPGIARNVDQSFDSDSFNIHESKVAQEPRIFETQDQQQTDPEDGANTQRNFLAEPKRNENYFQNKPSSSLKVINNQEDNIFACSGQLFLTGQTTERIDFKRVLDERCTSPAPTPTPTPSPPQTLYSQKQLLDLDPKVVEMNPQDDSKPVFISKYSIEEARLAYIVKQARLRIKLESLVKVSRRYKTLFYGLKKNHPHNCALINPIVFLLRRIIYTMIIIFMFDMPFFASLILLAISFALLAYVITENQWEDSLINQQHIFNEVALYICVVFIILFCDTSVLQSSQDVLGWALIGVFVAVVVFNVVVIAIFTVRYFKLLVLMLRHKIKARTNSKVSPTIENLQNKDDQGDQKIESPTKLKLLKPNFDLSQDNEAQSSRFALDDALMLNPITLVSSIDQIPEQLDQIPEQLDQKEKKPVIIPLTEVSFEVFEQFAEQGAVNRAEGQQESFDKSIEQKGNSKAGKYSCSFDSPKVQSAQKQQLSIEASINVEKLRDYDKQNDIINVIDNANESSSMDHDFSVGESEGAHGSLPTVTIQNNLASAALATIIQRPEQMLPEKEEVPPSRDALPSIQTPLLNGRNYKKNVTCDFLEAVDEQNITGFALEPTHTDNIDRAQPFFDFAQEIEIVQHREENVIQIDVDSVKAITIGQESGDEQSLQIDKNTNYFASTTKRFGASAAQGKLSVDESDVTSNNAESMAQTMHGAGFFKHKKRKNKSSDNSSFIGHTNFQEQINEDNDSDELQLGRGLVIQKRNKWLTQQADDINNIEEVKQLAPKPVELSKPKTLKAGPKFVTSSRSAKHIIEVKPAEKLQINDEKNKKAKSKISGGKVAPKTVKRGNLM